MDPLWNSTNYTGTALPSLIIFLHLVILQLLFVRLLAVRAVMARTLAELLLEMVPAKLGMTMVNDGLRNFAPCTGKAVFGFLIIFLTVLFLIL